MTSQEAGTIATPRAAKGRTTVDHNSVEVTFIGEGTEARCLSVCARNKRMRSKQYESVRDTVYITIDCAENRNPATMAAYIRQVADQVEQFPMMNVPEDWEYVKEQPTSPAPVAGRHFKNRYMVESRFAFDVDLVVSADTPEEAKQVVQRVIECCEFKQPGPVFNYPANNLIGLVNIDHAEGWPESIDIVKKLGPTPAAAPVPAAT